jgi:hypothetical protein
VIWGGGNRLIFNELTNIPQAFCGYSFILADFIERAIIYIGKKNRAKIRIIYDFRCTIYDFLAAAFMWLRRFYAFGVSVASPFQWLRRFC